LRKLREERLGKKQLAAAKEQMMGQIAMGEENNVSFMMMMARNLLDQGRITTLDELFSQVKDTSAEDLMTLANEIFKENKFSYLMMEPAPAMDILNKGLLQYSEEHTTLESELLKKINRDTHTEVSKPRMLSGHLQGRVLAMISRMINPTVILEIGTYTGYSAICLAEGLSSNGN